MTTSNDSPFVEKYLTPIAVLLGAIIIAVAFAFGTGERPQTTGDANQPSVVDIKNVKTENSPSIGSATAPVVIATWFDFQCRFCKQFETTTLHEVTKNYVEQGKVRIVYKDFQFLGPASLETALYSRALWEAAPDKWGNWFFDVMSAEGESTLQKSALDTLAKKHGIDTARVAKLMTDKGATYKAAIEADRQEGQNNGISGTPGTIIGTTLLSGAQPYASVEPLIKTLLGE